MNISDESRENLARFGAIVQQINRYYDACAKFYDMSLNSLRVLHILYRYPDGCAQKTIQDELLFPKQTVNSIIKAFTAKGYVSFKPSPEDGREKLIFLSPEGLSKTENANMAINKMQITAWKVLSAEQEIKLLQLLEIFESALKQESAQLMAPPAHQAEDNE